MSHKVVKLAFRSKRKSPTRIADEHIRFAYGSLHHRINSVAPDKVG